MPCLLGSQWFCSLGPTVLLLLTPGANSISLAIALSLQLFFLFPERQLMFVANWFYQPTFCLQNLRSLKPLFLLSVFSQTEKLTVFLVIEHSQKPLGLWHTSSLEKAFSTDPFFTTPSLFLALLRQLSGSISHLPNLFSKSYTFGLLSKHTFITVYFLIFSSFVIWIGLQNSK